MLTALTLPHHHSPVPGDRPIAYPGNRSPTLLLPGPQGDMSISGRDRSMMARQPDSVGARRWMHQPEALVGSSRSSPNLYAASLHRPMDGSMDGPRGGSKLSSPPHGRRASGASSLRGSPGLSPVLTRSSLAMATTPPPAASQPLDPEISRW